MRLTTIALAIIGSAAFAAISGCGDSNNSTTSSSARTRNGIGAPRAKVRFVRPKEASTQGRTIVAQVKFKNFKLAPKHVGMTAKRGEGHLHFSLDRGKFDYPKYSGANGKEAVKLGVQGKYSPSTAPSITYSHIPPGTHELEVYLANNDHTSTGVFTFVSFFVRGGAGGPAPPSAGSNGSGSGY